MIFSSIPFIFAFLPLVLAGYYILANIKSSLAAAWLVAASLVFYGYWNPIYLLLLLGSIAWNFLTARWIVRIGEEHGRSKFIALCVAIVGNLGLLAYYKYLFPTIGFLAAHHLVSENWERQVILPLGISFFTFTQIGYLVDSYSGKTKDSSLLSYMLFVTFFPHLIAGPILHNREMMPQFADPKTFQFRGENLAVGIAIFAFGISKKVLLADPLGFTADAGFANANSLGAIGAWLVVLSYSLQLYFDFSGYSDMAIGLARMFGIVFPINFNSPYKATSIIDFWARWHMTLTRYLTLYLFNPVAMRASRRWLKQGRSVSRKGTRNFAAFAKMVLGPTFFTMALAGIWHGAGLQFLVFGLLHATYLSINHAWRIFGPQHQQPFFISNIGFVLITYFAVLLAQVVFRADSLAEAIAVITAMAGRTDTLFNPVHGFAGVRIVLGFAICFLLPNTQQIMRNYRPVLEQVIAPRWQTLCWQPGLGWGIASGAILFASLVRMSDVSKFLYFQF
jgi:alginate O-acetyltransferase complex protein AlgI